MKHNLIKTDNYLLNDVEKQILMRHEIIKTEAKQTS